MDLYQIIYHFHVRWFQGMFPAKQLYVLVEAVQIQLDAESASLS